MKQATGSSSVWLWLWRETGRSLIVLILVLTALDMLTTRTDWRFLVFGHFLLNAIPGILFFALTFAIARNARLSAIMTLLVCGLIYLVNFRKYFYWNLYLTPDDFEFPIAFSDVADVIIENQDVKDTLITLAITGILAWLVAWFLAWKFRNQESEFPIVMRATMLLIVGVVSLTLYGGNKNAGAVMSGLMMVPNNLDVGEQLKYGLFNHLYLSAAQPPLNEEMLEGDPAAILEYAGSRPNSALEQAGAPPDVIVVLAESVFDPLTLRTDFRADPLAELRAGTMENRTDGLTRVQTVGGATWISSYTFLTGIPGPLFGSRGRWPFGLVDSDTWTVAKALQSLGYKTYALYPVAGDFMFDARKRYLELGFDEFLDINDIKARFGAADGSFDGQVLNAADRILSDDDGPSFVFALTIDTHSPYADEGNARFVDEAVGTPELQEYFRQQSVFSAKMATFMDRQDKKGDRLILAMFGDHFPPMPRVIEEIGFRDDVEAPLLRTPYLIHSTYSEPNADFPDLDLSYLAGLVLDQAHIDGGQYFQVNAAVRDLCRGRFVDCDAEPALLQSYYAYLGANIATHTTSQPYIAAIKEKYFENMFLVACDCDTGMIGFTEPIFVTAQREEYPYGHQPPGQQRQHP